MCIFQEKQSPVRNNRHKPDYGMFGTGSDAFITAGLFIRPGGVRLPAEVKDRGQLGSARRVNGLISGVKSTIMTLCCRENPFPA